MSPQGFTKIIHNLERDLGVPLFETDERGVRKPTAYAEEFYHYAKRLQKERGQLKSAFDRIASEGCFELKIACALGVPGLFGAESIQGFSRVRPGVTVMFSELPDTLCDSLVAEGLFDLGLTIQPVEENLNSRDLFASAMSIWVNKTDPLSKRDSLTLNDLAGHSLAMPGREFRCYQNLKSACAEADVDMPEVIEYSEIFWIYYYVLSKKGLGFCLPHLAELDIFENPESIVAIPLEGLGWKVCLTWPEGRELAEHERDYLSYLKKQARNLSRRQRQSV